MARVITIGITCFNAADTIERAVQSALAQNWPLFEVVIVDDSSTDGSFEILNSLARKDERIHVFRHEINRGYPSALNTIIENSNGEFIAIFDDDDESQPDRIQDQFAAITAYEKEKGTSFIACYTNRTVFKHGGSVDRVFCIGRHAPQPHGAMVADFLLLNDSSPAYTFGEFGSCTLMARRSVFEAVGSFDPAFRRSAEWDWAIRMALLGGNFIGCDAPLVNQHKTATADKTGRKPLDYALLLRRKYKDYLLGQGVYTYSVMMAHVRFYYFRRQRVRYYIALLAAFMMKPIRMWQLWRGRR